VIVLAFLIPLASVGGFFAANKLLPPPHQEASPAKNATSQKVKTDGQPASEPTEAAGQTPQPKPAPPAPVANAPSDDVQVQIETMKKQHQEMQAQIEALKKQPAAPRSVRSAAMPREGVLIIDGKNVKESAQGLKKAIESMNGL